MQNVLVKAIDMMGDQWTT